MRFLPILVVLVLPGCLTGTTVFKFPQERQLIEPLVPQCPDDYDEVKPWYEDPDDCNCYYVCDMYGGMVRMCCPAGLWFDSTTMNCHYTFSFTKEKQAACYGNLRGEGTTKQLKEIFLGRCWDYQHYRNPEPFKEELKDCNALFEKFVQVFFKKSACGGVALEDYDDFLDATAHDIPRDFQMFWSGTFGAARDYCNEGTRQTTLEDTLGGYLLNELSWCGSREDPGINYDACPPFAGCDGEAMSSFWGRASEKYASLATGLATVMLNGSIPGRPAFRNTSFFAQHELVSFKVPELHTLRIWVLHDLGMPATETCGFGSVEVLQIQAASMGLEVICEDNPPEIHAMLCVDKPDFPECAMYDKGTESPGGGNDEDAIPLEARLAPPQPIIPEVNSEEVYQVQGENKNDVKVIEESKVKVNQGGNEVFQGENAVYSNDAPEGFVERNLPLKQQPQQQQREAVHVNRDDVHKTDQRRRESNPRPRPHFRSQQNLGGAVFQPEK